MDTPKKPNWALIAPAIVGCTAIAGGIAGLAYALRKRIPKVGPNQAGQGQNNMPRSMEEAVKQAKSQYGRAESMTPNSPAWYDLEVPISRPPASTGFVFPR